MGSSHSTAVLTLIVFLVGVVVLGLTSPPREATYQTQATSAPWLLR